MFCITWPWSSFFFFFFFFFLVKVIWGHWTILTPPEEHKYKETERWERTQARHQLAHGADTSRSNHIRCICPSAGDLCLQYHSARPKLCFYHPTFQRYSTPQDCLARQLLWHTATLPDRAFSLTHLSLFLSCFSSVSPHFRCVLQLPDHPGLSSKSTFTAAEFSWGGAGGVIAFCAAVWSSNSTGKHMHALSVCVWGSRFGPVHLC